MNTTFEEIKKLLKKQTGKDINMDSNLRDLGIDSLELLSFVVKAEEKFNIQIDDSELMNLNIIKDVVEAIDKKLSQ